MHTLLLQAQGQSSPYSSLIFFAAIIAVFYFFMIRPQQKKSKEQKKFIEDIGKGDEVVTIGGLHGRIAETEDDTFILEVERGGRLKISKSAVSLDNTKAAYGAKKKS
jgi:preprotein translocase subunit YajC